MTGLDLINPADIALPGGPYSHGVLAPAGARMLHISGQIGVARDGTLATGFASQARAAWQNLAAVLAAAGMDVHHLVKVTTFVTDPAHLPELGPVRTAFLGQARPASTLLVVAALARPQWLIEIEAVACG